MKTIKMNRQAWLKEIPELIKTLKLKYNFYYSGQYARTQKRIQQLVEEKHAKNKHKIILYTNYKDWYLVVYTKNNPTIYWCPDYEGDNWRCIRYFEKKFRKAYETAEKLIQEKEESSWNLK